MLIVEFSYNFLYVWNYCTKLYDKHVRTYDNCMKSIFGQPGYAKKTLQRIYHSINFNYIKEAN